MSIQTDIEFVKSMLPEHYTVQESKRPGSIHCKSAIGIPDNPAYRFEPTNEIVTSQKENPWIFTLKPIKEYFGDRFLEVFHNTCTNHVDFTIYLK